MDKQRYITIQEWMLELGIKGSELLVFALVYGFSQDGETAFKGSAAYIAHWLGGVKKDTAYDVLKRLVEKGLIVKQERIEKGIKFCDYSVPCENGVLPRKSGYPTPKIGYHNNSDNIDINNNKSNREQGFVKPTIEQIREYCNERRNTINAESFFDYYEAKGWMLGTTKMKDWKAAVRNWENRRKEERNQPQAQPEKESNFAYMMRLGEKMFGHNNKDDYAEEQ